jgi:LmbE family N-acetylglucosaminyl deacetylase
MKKKLEALLQIELDPQSKIIVISPHLDDSVFSLGGLLYLLKEHMEVLVINVFSKSNYCFDKEIDATIATQIRKEEDHLALSELGEYQKINLDFKEALLRGHDRKDIFSKSLMDEELLMNQIKSSLKNLIDNNSIVIAPSAFGCHIDHLICRNAVNGLPKVHFYEDLPYANRNIKNDEALDFLKKYRKKTVFLNKTSIEKHLKACLIYKSQILERQYLEIKEFISTKGISIWQK